MIFIIPLFFGCINLYIGVREIRSKELYEYAIDKVIRGVAIVIITIAVYVFYLLNVEIN